MRGRGRLAVAVAGWPWRRDLLARAVWPEGRGQNLPIASGHRNDQQGQQRSELSSSSSDDHDVPLARIVRELSGEKSASSSDSAQCFHAPPDDIHPPCRG